MPETDSITLTLHAVDLLYHFSAWPNARVAIGAAPAPCPESPAEVLAEMDGSNIERVFVSQCKKWSCERQWMCVDTRLEDVQRYLAVSPRFVGLAGYNPFDIAESLREIELAVASRGFRGVYVHPESFRLPLSDERVYPVFAKASELGVPVLVQFTAEQPLEALTGELERIAADFPSLVLALAHPRPRPAILNELAACDNLFFVLDSGGLDWIAARKDDRAFLTGDVFRSRCMWGSNGQSWAYARASWEHLPLSSEAAAAWLRENAVRAFKLGSPLASRLPNSIVEDPTAAER
jgi:predicted TIM-barrel fold metal-dependent hydrolase